MKIIRDILISTLFFVSFAVNAEEAHLFTWVDQDDSLYPALYRQIWS